MVDMFWVAINDCDDNGVGGSRGVRFLFKTVVKIALAVQQIIILGLKSLKEGNQ